MPSNATPWLLACLLATGCATAMATSEPHPDAVETSDAAQADTTADVPPALACNGAPQLCDRRFDQVAYACAHNAMSNADEAWLVPNQRHGLVAQLDDGVRAFMIDVHLYNGDDAQWQGKTMLCHGSCDLGTELLATALTKIRTWLDAHPHEVIAFVLESYVDDAAIEQALVEANLLDLCHHQEKAKPFPTLRQMIQSDKRVFVMVEQGTGPALWRHGYTEFAWDTKYANASVADFDCKLLRGKKGNPLFVVNHFLTQGVQSHEKLSELANHDPVLHDHLAQCQQEGGQLPNFVAVDYYDIGDVTQVVRALNGL